MDCQEIKKNHSGQKPFPSEKASPIVMDKKPDFFKNRFPVPDLVSNKITRVRSGSQLYVFSSMYHSSYLFINEITVYLDKKTIQKCLDIGQIKLIWAQ